MDAVPPDARTLRELAGLVQDRGQDVLAKLHSDAPVLLVRPVSKETHAFLVGTTPDRRPTEKFHTEQTDETQERPVQSEYPPLGQGANLVVPVSKGERNPFVGVVAVGRAANNDIILSTPNVSKLHAFLKLSPDWWQVEDRGSTNGTLLDGVLVEPKTSHRLEFGSEVTFGGVGGLFVETPQLASLCRMVLPEGT